MSMSSHSNLWVCYSIFINFDLPFHHQFFLKFLYCFMFAFFSLSNLCIGIYSIYISLIRASCWEICLLFPYTMYISYIFFWFLIRFSLFAIYLYNFIHRFDRVQLDYRVSVVRLPLHWISLDFASPKGIPTLWLPRSDMSISVRIITYCYLFILLFLLEFCCHASQV